MKKIIATGNAPAAIVLHEPDAILLLGLIVAKEMGWPTPPAVKLPKAHHAAFAGRSASLDASGRLGLA